MQLDIFNDSDDVRLRNDAARALAQHDVPAARSARDALGSAFPDDDALTALDTAISALVAMTDAAPFADHGAVARIRTMLDDEAAPAAQRLLGERDTTTWLQALYDRAAHRAESLAFDARHADDHAASLWLRAGNWAAAERSASGIASWRRIPAPLGWMAEARVRRAGIDEAWPLLAELAWLAPTRFAAISRRLDEPSFDKLLRQFGATFEGDGGVHDLAWFPAWALTQKAGLARLIGAAQAQNHSEPEQATRLLVMLIGLEHQGRQRGITEARRQLKDLHAGLFAAYMASR